MDEVLEGNYKMNKFPIGSVIESYFSYVSDKLVCGFKTTECGLGIYELEFTDSNGIITGRFEFTQTYVEGAYRLKEGEEDEN